MLCIGLAASNGPRCSAARPGRGCSPRVIALPSLASTSVDSTSGASGL